jgi:glycosyltransferase involved in cell wall biosynthesis
MTSPPAACVIRQHYVPQDTRVEREAAALASFGYRVDVLCLRKPGEAAVERRDGLTIRRLPLRHTREGAARYLAEYGIFFAAAGTLATLLHARRRYRLVQVHSVPDVLVFAALVPRLTGAAVLLDLQECMPEFYATKFGVALDHPVVRLLGALEQASIRFADHVITPTRQMRETFVARGADPRRISVVMDGADERVFRANGGARPSTSDGFTVISHGTVEAHYGLDTVIRAVAMLRDEIPELRFEIYGDGSDLGRLRDLAAALEVQDRVRFSGGFVPVDELVGALAGADVGVVAMRRDPFREVTLASKMFDFVAMRKPIVASRTRSVEQTFGPSCVELFDCDDAADLARALRALHADPARRERLARRAAAAAAPCQWAVQREVYRAVVEETVARRGDPC